MSRKTGGKLTGPDQQPRLCVRWVRNPIVIPRGRRLRVLIYARFSTAEQKRRSIKAQIEFCKKCLRALGVTDITVIIIRDEALSGELRSRPGIDQVRAGILAGEYDLMLVEDSSRIYRDDVACVELVRLAVDNDIRVICVNDFVDTADVDWEDRLKRAAQFHAQMNRYGSERVKRSHEELWISGAAVGLLKPGYRRQCAQQMTESDRRKLPKFDEVDPRWAPVIKEAFERIAAGEAPWAVGSFLTAAGLPKASNAKSDVHTDRNVISLIRRPDYRGAQVFRGSVVRKMLSTGKKKARPNEKEEVLSREMPNLRIVEDWLWHAANAAIDARAPKVAPPRGRDNPQYGVPRNSRTPLSGIFLCRCNAKMHVDGCGKAAFRCREVRCGGCWNKATALRDKTYGWLRSAIVPEFQTLGGRVDAIIERAAKILDDAGALETRKALLLKRKVKLEKALMRLGESLASTDQGSDTLVTMLEEREGRLARVDAQLDSLEKKAGRCAPPRGAEIEDRRNEIIAAMERMDRTLRDELKLLTGEIRAVPYRQFGGDKVVLRARFELRLAALLPIRLRAVLANHVDGPVYKQFETIPMLVDLFEPSTGPKHGIEALRLREEERLGLTAIGRRLGITKRQANIAVQYGGAMRAAGMTDPYIELTEAPTAASRWRPRGYRKAQQDKQTPEGPLPTA